MNRRGVRSREPTEAAGDGWGRRWRTVASVLVLPAIGFLAGTGVDKWLDGFREIGRLEAKLEAKEAELGTLRAENQNLVERAEGTVAQNDLLSRYGATFTLYRRWRTGVDEGDVLPLGRCDGAPCFVAAFGGLRDPGSVGPGVLTFAAPADVPLVLVGITAPGTGAKVNATLGIPLLRGCRHFVYADRETLQFEVEDDRHASVILGVAVKPAEVQGETAGGVRFGGTCAPSDSAA
jgi:hypothetical protein